MADENVNLPDEEKKKGPSLLIILIITIVVTLIVAAGTSFFILNFLGSNTSSSEGSENTNQSLNSPIISTVEIVREGSRYPIMLKGGNDVAVVDALTLKVGSDDARNSISSNRIEVLEAIRMIFLNKTRTEISTLQGIELLKKQIRDSINEIIGYTGERENQGVLKANIVVLTISSTQWGEKMASNETLSQEEIDNLLNSFGGSGEEGEQSEEIETPQIEDKSVREYNFRRPVKFSREQQRTLQLIHENFAREISTYLSGRTRTFVEVRYASIDQITFSEFQQSLTTPTYMGIFSTDLLSGSAILQIGLDIGYVMIDKLLGGPGISIEDMRSPTDIEMSILRKESSVMLRSLSKAWANISEFDVQLDKVETNPQFVQIAPPNEMTVLITMSITVRDVQGFINICFPSSTLEPVSDKLNTRMWTQSYKYSEKSKEDLKKLIMLSEMSLSAVLGQTTLSLNDLLRVQTGDVLRLNSFYEDPINVEIQGTPVYKSNIGKHKGYYAVKIEEENKELLEKIMLEQSLHKEFDKSKEEENEENGGEKDVEWWFS